MILNSNYITIEVNNHKAVANPESKTKMDEVNCLVRKGDNHLCTLFICGITEEIEKLKEYMNDFEKDMTVKRIIERAVALDLFVSIKVLSYGLRNIITLLKEKQYVKSNNLYVKENFVLGYMFAKYPDLAYRG